MEYTELFAVNGGEASYFFSLWTPYCQTLQLWFCPMTCKRIDFRSCMEIQQATDIALPDCAHFCNIFLFSFRFSQSSGFILRIKKTIHSEKRNNAKLEGKQHYDLVFVFLFCVCEFNQNESLSRWLNFSMWRRFANDRSSERANKRTNERTIHRIVFHSARIASTIRFAY